jgi:TPR repeat protein
MRKILIIGIATLLLGACAQNKYLQEGKNNFQAKNYSAAMVDLLPQAANGNSDAQYAVGWMYFYGRGITQDQAVGKNWIDQAAAQGNIPAIRAKTAIERQAEKNSAK